MKWNETWPFIWTSVEGDRALCLGISMWLSSLLFLSESGAKDFMTYFSHLQGWTEEVMKTSQLLK